MEFQLNAFSDAAMVTQYLSPADWERFGRFLQGLHPNLHPYGAEPGPDRSHRLRWKRTDRGLSLVLLADVSGSMKEGQRLEKAKRAVARLVESDTIHEIAVWAFNSRRDATNIRLIVPFTEDTEAAREAVAALEAGGGTPLARAILASGHYLLRESRFEDKVLIVLSDGADTNKRSPAESIQILQREARDMSFRVERSAR